MSAVPARVAAEAAQADATLAELAAAAANPPAPDAPPPPPAPGDPPPAPAPAPAAAAPALPAEVMEELQRARDFIATQNGRLQAQAEQMRELQRQLESAHRPPPAAPAPPPPLVTPKDVEDYGDDLIDLISRVAEQKIGVRLDQLVLRLGAVENRVGNTSRVVEQTQSVVQNDADSRYFAVLDRLVPEWEAVNATKAFVDWLKKRDKLSGSTYFDLLSSAHQRRDAERVIEVFRAYKPELVVDPSAAPTPSTTPPSQPGRIDPSSLAAPVTTAPNTPPSQPQAGPIWTQADVDKLYDDKVKGRISAQEFERLERQYHQAFAEGRVSVN